MAPMLGQRLVRHCVLDARGTAEDVYPARHAHRGLHENTPGAWPGASTIEATRQPKEGESSMCWHPKSEDSSGPSLGLFVAILVVTAIGLGYLAFFSAKNAKVAAPTPVHS